MSRFRDTTNSQYLIVFLSLVEASGWNGFLQFLHYSVFDNFLLFAEDGVYPLHIAATLGKLEICQVVVEHGGNVDVQNNVRDDLYQQYAQHANNVLFCDRVVFAEEAQLKIAKASCNHSEE